MYRIGDFIPAGTPVWIKRYGQDKQGWHTDGQMEETIGLSGLLGGNIILGSRDEHVRVGFTPGMLTHGVNHWYYFGNQISTTPEATILRPNIKSIVVSGGEIREEESDSG